MGHAMVVGGAPNMTVPVTGIQLSSIAEGSIVKLNENGSPVEFYVACHNYEAVLNGEGRTLLVRKDCYDTREWHSSDVNAWASCSLRSWLNGDYLNLLDDNARELIGTTKYYYTPGNGTTSVTTRSDAVFQLSVTELGKTAADANIEGIALPIASTLQIAYHNGSSVIQWTRSPFKSVTYYAYVLGDNGGVSQFVCNYAGCCSRPVFTLPSTAVFDETTMLLKGVS